MWTQVLEYFREKIAKFGWKDSRDVPGFRVATRLKKTFIVNYIL